MEMKNSLDEKTSEQRKRLNELAKKYAKLREEKNFTISRLSKAFPKLTIYQPKRFKEQLNELRNNLRK